MKTESIAAETGAGSERAVSAAVRLLREGAVVALPTETVYGLAANALDAQAVAKIFEAKERPRFDPLIVHLPNEDWLERVATIPPADEALIRCLVERFWPGPLTLILPRRPVIPELVAAGLETVAVRVSAHPVFRNIVTSFAGPLAAPSANRFGRISPTTAEHVRSELDGRIPLIVDGGPTQHGLESTIVAVRRGRIDVLRQGPITLEDLREFGAAELLEAGARLEAPGQLPSHYAPQTPLVLSSRLDDFQMPSGRRIGALSWREDVSGAFETARVLSARGDFAEAAANLFRYLRELDEAGLDLIVAEKLADTGLGRAINDRLRRAAAPR